MSVSGPALVGIANALKQFDRAAESVQRATAPDVEGADEVDLSTAATQLLAARTAFEAAIKVAQTADEVEQHAIDLLA